MRKFLAALPLVLAMASPAMDDRARIACCMTDTKGQEITYDFIHLGNDRL